VSGWLPQSSFIAKTSLPLTAYSNPPALEIGKWFVGFAPGNGALVNEAKKSVSPIRNIVLSTELSGVWKPTWLIGRANRFNVQSNSFTKT
jgi:hypothetical protein